MPENRIQNTAQYAVEVNNLSKSFGEKLTLDDLSMHLKPKENLIILGQSGTGKSVLIKCISGLIRPEAGEVLIFGSDLVKMNSKELNETRMNIGFSFQGSALYDSLSVAENLEFPLRRNLKITDKGVLQEKVEKALEDVGLISALHKMPSELSGGMRKRIGIARTLILEPEIMLYDEPTAGLDPYTCMEINDLILEIQDTHHTSGIIITHDISCAERTGNRLNYLKHGKVLQDGTFDALRADPVDEDLKKFFEYYNQNTNARA